MALSKTIAEKLLSHNLRLDLSIGNENVESTNTKLPKNQEKTKRFKQALGIISFNKDSIGEKFN